MKTDRELLELAAKAAMVDAYWDEEYQRMQMDFMHKGGTNYEEWNPLTDDGDALRLAVRLRIDVHTSDTFGTGGAGFTTADCFRGGKIISMQIPHDSDPCAATRRAIVRAAAAIGEGMK